MAVVAIFASATDLKIAFLANDDVLGCQRAVFAEADSGWPIFNAHCVPWFVWSSGKRDGVPWGRLPKYLGDNF